jgi:hypothetical protein
LDIAPIVCRNDIHRLKAVALRSITVIHVTEASTLTVDAVDGVDDDLDVDGITLWDFFP